MPLAQAEVERIIREGGSVSFPGVEGPVTSLDDIPKDWKFGEDLTLDSPDHPTNKKIAQQQLAATLNLDPASDEEYQDYLRFKAARDKAVNMKSSDISSTLDGEGESDDDAGSDDSGDSGDSGNSGDSGDSSDPNAPKKPGRPAKQPSVETK